MKYTIRISALFLAVLILVTSLPLGVLASDEQVKTTVSIAPTDVNNTAGANKVSGVVLPENKKDIITATDNNILYGNEAAITRALWLHNLAVVFDMTVETMAAPDNYFYDLTEDHPYYNDIILAVSFGVVDIEAGEDLYPDDPLTRDFAASTLNACLSYSLDESAEYTYTDFEECSDPIAAQIALNRGWFTATDGMFCPTLTVTDAEVSYMLEDAQRVLSATVIDENYNDTYEFAEDVKVIPDGTAVTEDEDGTLTITDLPVDVSEGDKFAVFFNSIPVVYTALSVKVTGNATVIETQAADPDEVFTAVDAQGVIYDMELIPFEGVDMSVEEESDGLAKAGGSKTIKTINLNSTLEIFDGFELTIGVTMTDPTVNYKLNEDYGYVAFVSDTDVTYGFTCDLLPEKYDGTINLLTVNIGGVGTFEISVEIVLEGTLNGNTKGILTAGLEYTKNEGIRAVKSFYQKGSGCSADLSGSIGFKALIGITKLPFVTAYLYARIGFKATVSVFKYEFDDVVDKCVSFSGYLYGEYGGYASVDVGNWSVTFNPKEEFYHAGNSPVRISHHYEFGEKVPKCTRGMSGGGRYTTSSSSAYGGNGWNGCNGAYGVVDGFQVLLYEYSVDSNGDAIITKFKNDYYTVTLPKEIDGHKVISIGGNSFRAKGMVNLSIPTTVTKIENSAFESCVSIKKLNIPNSVTKIYSNAFENCTSLKEINIPASVRQIDPRAFAKTALTKIEIPKTLESGGANGADSPFADCKDLKEITFEEGITKIPQNIFSHCDSIEKIIIPDTVSTISNHAFNGCENLRSVVLSESLSIIEPYAFKDCISLYSIDLPDSLTEIEREAFKGCTGLTSVDFPDDLSNIAQGAFINCNNLASVKLPANITQFGDEVFSNTALTEIEIPKSLDRCLGSSRRGPFSDCKNLKKVVFEEGTDSIPEKLFAGCSGLEEITIPDTVKVIEASAFINCSNLKKVTLPETLERIEPYAFQGCTSLTEIDLPDSLTEISTEAFRKCSALISVEIPDGVTHIAHMAFYECSALSSVKLPDDLVSIGEHAFSLTALREINIPKSLDVTSGYAFYGCTDLKSVTFEKGTVQIAERLLQGCSGIEEISVPDTVAIIENLAFANCSNLKKVFIPNSVTDIYPNAFNDSPNVIIEGYSGSYAQTFARNNGISFVDVAPFCITSVDNYTVTIDGIEDIKEIRYAIGHYTTGTEVRAAEKNQTLSAALVAKYTVDGVMTYDVPWVGEYTFWVRTNDGSGYFLYCDVNKIEPYLESDGLKLTVKDFGEDYKDMWIAEGTWNSYAEIKNMATVKYQAAAAKLSNYFATHDFVYTTANPGAHTVLIRYNDGTQDVLHINLTVDVPTFDVNGLRVTVANIPGVKIIRTAYGEYNSVAEIKAAKGVRNFNNKTEIKGAESYMIQYRDEGVVTVIVEYVTGYKHIERVKITKKVPDFTQVGGTVTFGDLEGLVMIRYASGEYASSSAIKAAAGSKYLKPDAINENGEIVVSDLANGRYTFCVQYDDESYNYYIVTVE